MNNKMKNPVLRIVLRIIGLLALALLLFVAAVIVTGLVDAFAGTGSREFYSPDVTFARFYPPGVSAQGAAAAEQRAATAQESAADDRGAAAEQGAPAEQRAATAQESAADDRGAAAERYPAVLLIHEWWGLNAEHLEKARALAQEGYVVYAPDAHGGRLAETVPGALMLMMTRPDAETFADIDAAYQAMLNDPAVDSTRTAVAGFCFGGRQAMYLGVRNSMPAATASFYGSGLITDPADMGFLGEGGAVLGIFGEEDSSIPLEEVELFRAALESRGADYRQYIYGDVGHAFVKSDNLYTPGPWSEAWQEFLRFLSETLAPPPSTP
ncbi:MAG: dienelactone hydrolase family protein [Salinispira sp.]